MAVRSTAVCARESVIKSAQVASRRRRAAPTRTCVGCRQRAEATELLRVVAVRASAQESESSDADLRVVPDPRRREAGRGAWVHRDRACVGLAQRRRAFARALRIVGSRDVDSSAVAEFVAVTR